ncbi:LysR family transcriptional regulator [Mesorhizobium sp. IMUNJ 23232]|uniref:LysR family transcriptional regulator n=1 Tax=Mesorhizobium sp. IMUNJ 23232 TaxID=3376064 RepID=UPI003799DB8A
MHFEWSDLRYFLAVARSGTTLGAARALDVNQTTCARRITALERALNTTLFERSASGYKLTSQGSALMEQAQFVEAGAEAFGRPVEALRTERGLIRFTTSDWMVEQIAQTAITQFARKRPDIRIALEVSDRKLDLIGGEADVALRGGFSLNEPALIARKVAETPWAFYCSVGYAERHGAPRTMDEALRRPLATPAGRAEVLFREWHANVNISYSTNSTATLVDAIAGNDFVGILPMPVGDARHDLHFCCPVEHVTPSIWIVYPERLRRAQHVRAFVDHLSTHTKHWRQQHRRTASAALAEEATER